MRTSAFSRASQGARVRAGRSSRATRTLPLRLLPVKWRPTPTTCMSLSSSLYNPVFSKVVEAITSKAFCSLTPSPFPELQQTICAWSLTPVPKQALYERSGDVVAHQVHFFFISPIHIRIALALSCAERKTIGDPWVNTILHYLNTSLVTYAVSPSHPIRAKTPVLHLVLL